jgi:hypothetical protein
MSLLSRRALLWGTTGTLGTLAVLGVGSAFACDRLMTAARTPAEAAARLSAALPEVFAPDRLSAHWPGEESPADLLAELGARPRIAAALATDCTATRRAFLRAEIAQDFAAGDICVTDRLVASRTECLVARLCGTAA